jgi:hypothetical protein
VIWVATELRCDKRLHGVLTNDGVLEISCRSHLCGHRDGVVVIHRFDATTGAFLETKFYKDASEVRKGQGDALGQRTPVRRS